MSNVTTNVSDYIRKKGINLSKLARETEIPYMALYDSLANSGRQRDLRDAEFLSICCFLGVDPREFADHEESEAEKEAV